MIFRILVVAIGILLNTPPALLQSTFSSEQGALTSVTTTSESPVTSTSESSVTSTSELSVTASVTSPVTATNEIFSSVTDSISVGRTTDAPEQKSFRVADCPEGWYRVQLQSTKRQDIGSHRCLKFFSERDTYQKAQERCEREGSFLVFISYSAAMPRDLFISQVNITGQSFWTGLQLINNVFYWDDIIPIRYDRYNGHCPGCEFQLTLNASAQEYPSTLSSCTKQGDADKQRPFLDRSFSVSSANEFGWGCEGGPLHDGCVSASLASNFAASQQEATLVFSSESCQTKLPYFCFTKIIDSYSFIEDPDCGKPWMYNSYDGFSYAYFGNISSKNYSEAKAACEAANSIISPVSTVDNLNVLTNFLRDQAVEVYIESTGSSNNLCKVLRFDNGNVPTGVVDCSRKLPFTCRKICGGTAIVTLKFNADSSSMRCSTSTKMTGPVFWSRNGAYWPGQEPNAVSTTPVGGIASYRCGFFDGRRTTRRIWSNSVLAYNSNALTSYRVLIVLNETFNPMMLSYLYNIPLNDDRQPPATQWIYIFTSSFGTDEEVLKESATLIGISPLTATTTIAYFDVTLREDVQTQGNVTGRFQRLWNIANNTNKNSRSQAMDLLVRSPFHCLDPLVSQSSIRFVNPSTTMIGEWAPLGTCGSDGTLSCSGDFATGAFWDASTWYLNASSRDYGCIMGLLKNLSQEVDDGETAVTVLKILVSLTDSSEGIDQSAMALIADVVSKAFTAVKNISFQDYLLEVPHLIGAMVSNLMNAKSGEVFDKKSSANTSFQRILEEAVMWLMMKASFAMGTANAINSTLLSFNSRNLAFQVDLEEGNVGLMVSGPVNTSYLSPLRLLNGTAAEFTGRQSTALLFDQRYANIPKAYIVYADSILFRALTRKWMVKHRVISAQLLLPPEMGSTNNVAMTSFRDFYEENDQHLLACGFWDFNISGWSVSGCSKNKTADGNVICSCNHLTNYAVLLDMAPSSTNAESERALTIVTYIGLGLSIVGLSAVIVSFMAIRVMRKTNPQKVLFNLSISLLSLNIVFLVGIDKTESRNGCIAVAALLHYFVLSSFAWMLIEAIEQYLRFVKVLGAYIPRFIIKTSIPAWGVPGIIVAAMCSTRLDLYYNTLYCLPQPPVVQFAIAVPAGAILVVNIVIFSMVLRNVCCLHRTLQLRHNQSERRQILLHGQVGLAMSCVLGLTWVFGYFQIPQVSELRLISQWVFCICNSIQGFIIFIFFCALKQSFWQSWKKACCKRRLIRQGYNISLDDLLRTSAATKSTTSS